jgi:hypothetical protein
MKENEAAPAGGKRRKRPLPLGELQARVNDASQHGLFTAIDVEVLANVPLTILITPRKGGRRSEVEDALGFIASELFPLGDESLKPLFRGVELTRLGHIMTTGCDVLPSTAPIYATPYPAKAMEYGDVVMAFDPSKLDKTFRRIPKSENPDTLLRLKQEYPTMLEVDDDLWFSTLPPGDGRTGTIYESVYTYFIPGEPREALLMLFLICDDADALRAEFRRFGVSPPA